MSYKIVKATDLRAIGVPVNEAYNTTVTSGDSYYDGMEMVEFAGVGTVSAIEGLGGVFLNLKVSDFFLRDANGEVSLVPACGFLPRFTQNFKVDNSAEVSRDIFGMTVCPVRATVRASRLPSSVPLIVSRGLVHSLGRHDFVYVTDISGKCERLDGRKVYSRLLKPV